MLTQEELKKILDYDPETGVFTWKKHPSKAARVKEGEVAGWVDSKGYISIRVLDKTYKAHRLAFLWMEGYTPEHDVDHINRDRSDNRWVNLRHASRACNMQNKETYKNNSSGIPGVTYVKREKKFKARITVAGKTCSLGNYCDKIEAAFARLTAELDHPEWSCNTDSPALTFLRQELPDFNFTKIMEVM